MLTPEQIQAAADRIVAALQPKKIILFGSYARGDATEHSDLDLMVVGPTTIRKIIPASIAGRDAVGFTGIGADVLVFSNEEFAKKSQWHSHPSYWAVHEGKVLYEK